MKIALQLKATLENLTNLKADGDDFRWYLKVKCVGCGEESKSFIYLTLLDSNPLKGTRGSASMVSKCKFCGRGNSMDIIKDTVTEYNVDDSGTFKNIVSFECRGMEPTDFSPRTGWAAKGADTSSVFAVDLSDGDWCDYDETAALSVGAYEVEHAFTKV